MRRIAVIGGGAAGMMAAIAAADAGSHVILLEKNEKLGKKLFITGKGRCNVTNAGDAESFFRNVMSNPKFLYSAFYQFDNQALMTFLEKAGCPLKVERGERVFPVSDHSSDVTAALTRELRKRNVEIRLHTEVKDILWEEARQEGEVLQGAEVLQKRDVLQSGEARQVKGLLLRNGERLSADCVIVATGGLSYASTGSTGDGYRFAGEMGHTIVGTCPALVPFCTAEPWCGGLMGLSLKNVSVRLLMEGREIYNGFGEMLFTHFGVSGPLILSASSFYVRELGKQGKKKNVRVENANPEGNQQTNQTALLLIDLKPALSEEQLDKRLLRDFEEYKGRQFQNALNGLFPARLIPVMIAQSGICPDKRVAEITREERRAFVRVIKNLPLTVTGTRDYAEAIITRGGVTVKEVNPSTMESRKVRGVYFAGEVLDLDALTGGFNLQIAWSTGHLAGCSAGKET